MLFLVLAFSLAIAVWGIILLPRFSIATLCTLVVVLGTFFGPDFFAFQGPVQVSVDRLVFLAIIGLGTAYLIRGDLQLPNPSVVDGIVAAMVCWYFVRAVTAGEAPQGSNPIGAWLFYVLLPAIGYGLIRISNVRKEQVSQAITVMIAVGVYVATLGVLEVRGWHTLIMPSYIGNPEVWEFLGRARGPLMNPSANGILLTIGLSFAVLRAHFGDRGETMFYGALSLVILMGVYATLTRGVWIGALLAIVFIFWTTTPRWLKVLGLSSVVLLGSVAAMGLKDQLLNMKRDKSLSAEDSAKSIALRPLLGIIAYEMFKDSPVVGHGFAVYMKSSVPYHQTPGYDMPLEQARGYTQHNIFLSSLVDTGIIGLTLYASLLITLTRKAWRLGNHARIAPLYRMVGLGMIGTMTGYLMGGMFQDVIVMPMIQFYLLFLAGFLVNAYQQTFEISIDDFSLRAPYIRRDDLVDLAAGRRATDPACSAKTPIDDATFRPAT